MIKENKGNKKITKNGEKGATQNIDLDGWIDLISDLLVKQKLKEMGK